MHVFAGCASCGLLEKLLRPVAAGTTFLATAAHGRACHAPHGAMEGQATHSEALQVVLRPPRHGSLGRRCCWMLRLAKKLLLCLIVVVCA
jgi:hypothetical protein